MSANVKEHSLSRNGIMIKIQLSKLLYIFKLKSNKENVHIVQRQQVKQKSRKILACLYQSYRAITCNSIMVKGPADICMHHCTLTFVDWQKSLVLMFWETNIWQQ